MKGNTDPYTLTHKHIETHSLTVPQHRQTDRKQQNICIKCIYNGTLISIEYIYLDFSSITDD